MSLLDFIKRNYIFIIIGIILQIICIIILLHTSYNKDTFVKESVSEDANQDTDQETEDANKEIEDADQEIEDADPETEDTDQDPDQDTDQDPNQKSKNKNTSLCVTTYDFQSGREAIKQSQSINCYDANFSNLINC